MTYKVRTTTYAEDKRRYIVRSSMLAAIERIDLEILDTADKLDLMTAAQLAEWKERLAFLRQYRDNLNLSIHHPDNRDVQTQLPKSRKSPKPREADPADGRLLQATPRQAGTGEARLPRRGDAGSPDRQVDQALRKGAGNKLAKKDGSRLHNQLKNTAMPGFRHCYDCGKDLPLAEFYPTCRHLSCRACFKKLRLARYNELKGKKPSRSPQDALEAAISEHASSG